MSIRAIKFPFTSFNVIEAQYSLELQGYLTREEFDQRIKELNEASKKSRLSRPLVFLPLFIMILAIGIVIPLVFTRQINNSVNNQFDGFQKTAQNSFTLWIWTVMGIFIGFILAMILSSCLNHKSRINQFRAYKKKLNEFNMNDNPRGINWRIESNAGYIDTNDSYRSPRMMYSQKYLVIEVGQPNTVPRIVNDTPVIESPPPPTYYESAKHNMRPS